MNDKLNQQNDTILKHEELMDEKEAIIEEEREEILSLKESLMNKDVVIEALSNTLSTKGAE